MAAGSENRDDVQEARQRQASPTNAPITEEERTVTRERAASLRRPFPWAVVGGVVVLVAVALVAALSVGAQYAIPVGVLALVIAVFLGTHRLLSLMRTRRYDTGAAQDKAAEAGDDPIPHFGFDEQSQLGATAEVSAEDQQAHTDMERSTGQG